MGLRAFFLRPLGVLIDAKKRKPYCILQYFSYEAKPYYNYAYKNLDMKCAHTWISVVGVHTLAAHGEDILPARDLHRARRAAQHAFLQPEGWLRPTACARRRVSVTNKMAAGTHPRDEAHLHVQAQQRVVHGEQRQAVARRQRQVGRRPERQRHRLLRHVLCGPSLPLRLDASSGSSITP